MAEFFFEIFCEEIPARMQVRAGQDLSKMLTEGLTKAGLTVENVTTFTGPRRLVFAADIPLRSPDISEERKGPRVGSPERALEGFMKAAGLSDISEAEVRTDPKKGEFYVAIMNSEGRDSAEIIQELIPTVMNNFPWPKSMKSGTSSFRWVRPLQGIICLLDDKVIDLEVGGIKSGNTTEGHRRLGKGPFKIKGLKDYVTALEGQGHVVLSHEKRKELIINQARKACNDKGLELIEDEGLLNEVAGLAEWPVVILGDMDPRFLELPSEVIRLSMRTHQKYFAVRDPKTHSLAPNFIVVANQAAPDGGKEIAKGNSKVLSARLSDAVFFQSEDRKKNLIDYYEKLDTVVFHKKLGSIKDKAERVAALARELAPKVGADPDKAEAAAKLAKCDLVTQTVIEFTSLQGQIGRLMYEAEEGADSSIATAIEDHYKPQGPSDSVPTDPVAVAVALADKLDTLVGFWAIDEKPTGSKDPFALRRAALGVVRIILENNVRLRWGELVGSALPRILVKLSLKAFDQPAEEISNLHAEGFISDQTFDRLVGEINKQYFEHADYWASEEGYDSLNTKFFTLYEFILDRLKVYLRDQGIRHDIIDAVFANGGDDLVAIVNSVKALQAFLETKDGEDLLAGYKRAANILKAEAKKGDLPEGAPTKPKAKESLALYEALQMAGGPIKTALENEDYAKAMRALADLREPIDAFFTHVQVISDDTAVKENNLRLLGLIRDTARQIADFEAISG